jgi:hypothetical protein
MAVIDKVCVNYNDNKVPLYSEEEEKRKKKERKRETGGWVLPQPDP